MNETPDSTEATEEVNPQATNVVPLHVVPITLQQTQPTGPDYVLTEEESKALSDFGGAVMSTDIDVEEVLAIARRAQQNLQTCGEVDQDEYRFVPLLDEYGQVQFDPDGEVIPQIDPATGDPIRNPGHNRPLIDIDTQRGAQKRQLLNLMLAKNLQKFYAGGFQTDVAYRPMGRGKGTLRTVVREGNDFYVDELSDGDMEELAEESACVVKITKDGIKHKGADAKVMKRVSAGHKALPMLKAVVNAPRYSIDEQMNFHIKSDIGYDPATACFVGKEFSIVRKAKPTDKDVKAALAVIDDLIGEFSFADDASRRNAYSLALTLALRSVFRTAPGFAIDADDPQSGKTLLVQVLCGANFGVDMIPSKLPENAGDQERRNIGAILKVADQGTDVSWFDEPRKSSDTSELVMPMFNLMLTAMSGYYTDRLVYHKNAISIDVQRTMILSGNNLAMNRELLRRTVLITLVKEAKEFSRDEDELVDHAKRQQGAFHQAIATLIDNWIAKGRPTPAHPFASFNTWLDIVGGILEAAGIVGLRQNPERSSAVAGVRAEFLHWIHSNVPDLTADRLGDRKTIMFKAVCDKVLTVPDGSKAHTALLEIVGMLAYHEPKTWAGVYDRIDTRTRKGLSEALGAAMKQTLSFTSHETTDGKVRIRARALTFRPLRYRITTGNERLDDRGGADQNQSSRRKP